MIDLIAQTPIIIGDYYTLTKAWIAARALRDLTTQLRID